MKISLLKIAAAGIAMGAMIMPLAASAQLPSHNLQHRVANQRTRIHKGVENGTLTHAQAMRMQAHDTMLSRRVASDKAANGGRLSATERARLTHRINRNSAHIYLKKH